MEIVINVRQFHVIGNVIQWNTRQIFHGHFMPGNIRKVPQGRGVAGDKSLAI